MDYEQEIRDLKSRIAELSAEVAALKEPMRRVNVWVDTLKQTSLTIATQLSDTQERVNSLLYQNPGIVADIIALEEILGPANQPTPNAPPFS